MFAVASLAKYHNYALYLLKDKKMSAFQVDIIFHTDEQSWPKVITLALKV